MQTDPLRARDHDLVDVVLVQLAAPFSYERCLYGRNIDLELAGNESGPFLSRTAMVEPIEMRIRDNCGPPFKSLLSYDQGR